MTRLAIAQDGYIICHDTLPYGPHPDAGQALCRGFYDQFPTRFTAVMTHLGSMREVAPPASAKEGNDARP